MEELREQLKKQNAEELARMEAQQAEIEEAYAKQKAELDKMGDLERQLIEKEARRERIDHQKNLDRNNKMGAQEVVAKLREEYEKGLDALGGAMEEERKRQFDSIQSQMEERKALVEQAKREKAEED